MAATLHSTGGVGAPGPAAASSPRSRRTSDAERTAHDLTLRLADSYTHAAQADTRAKQAADARVRHVVMHAQESNFTLWAALSREQELRREGHDRLEMMRGPVRVHARIRPLTSAERSRGFVPIVRCLPSGIVELRPIAVRASGVAATLKPKPRFYQFDAVYTPDCPQAHVFDDVRPLVQSAVDGHSASVVCFGPSRSGKTFTMFGNEATVISGDLGERAAGVAQRAGRELFRLLALEGGDMRAQATDFVPEGRLLEPSPVDGGARARSDRPATADSSGRKHSRDTGAIAGPGPGAGAGAGAGDARRRTHVGVVHAPPASAEDATAPASRPTSAAPRSKGAPGAGFITPLGLQLGDWVSGAGDRVASTAGRTGSGAPIRASKPPPGSKGWVEWGHFGLTAKVRVNVLEVRGDQVYDMLRRGRTPAVPLKTWVSAEGTSAVQDAVGVIVTSPEQFSEVIRSGLKRCHPRPKTSHLVVRVVVQVRRELDGMQRRGKLMLVDLATPERVLRPGLSPEETEDVRDVAVSLYRLGELLSGVARGDEAVSFMGHTLTQLLCDSISSGKGMLVAHASPTSVGQSETERALRFAGKIKLAKASQQAAAAAAAGGGDEGDRDAPARPRRRVSGAGRSGQRLASTAPAAAMRRWDGDDGHTLAATHGIVGPGIGRRRARVK